jgi:hypothetical protein
MQSSRLVRTTAFQSKAAVYVLPQPTGFEGSRSIVTEVLELDRFPVAERPQIPDMRLNLGSAPRPLSTDK